MNIFSIIRASFIEKAAKVNVKRLHALLTYAKESDCIILTEKEDREIVINALRIVSDISNDYNNLMKG